MRAGGGGDPFFAWVGLTADGGPAGRGLALSLPCTLTARAFWWCGKDAVLGTKLGAPQHHLGAFKTPGPRPHQNHNDQKILTHSKVWKLLI